MNFKDDEEFLDFMMRLLERLHQAGFDKQCIIRPIPVHFPMGLQGPSKA